MEVFLFRLIGTIDFIISIPNSYRYIFLFNHFAASFMIYLIIYRISVSHFQFCSIVFMSLLNLLNLGINRLIEMHFNLGCSLLTFLYCYTNSSFLNNHNFKIHWHLYYLEFHLCMNILIYIIQYNYFCFQMLKQLVLACLFFILFLGQMAHFLGSLTK